MIDFAKIADKWDIYTYPWRPWKKMIDFISKNYIKGDKTLILWATKEFRELFKNDKCSVCDLSSHMIKAWDVWNKREKIIIDDWFNLEGWNYDLIIWDLIFFLLDENKQEELIDLLLRKLSKKGKIIIRYWEVKKDISLEKELIINKIIESNNEFKKVIEYFNYISFELTFWLWYNFDDIYWLLLKYDKIIAKRFKEIFWNLLPYNNIEINFLSDKLKRYNNFTLSKFHLTEEKILFIKN